MELRELFEKLHPVPDADSIVFDHNYNCYVPKPAKNPSVFIGRNGQAILQTNLWQGFQSGHAAGLEDAAEEVQKHFIRGESLAGLFSSIAAAIRAMKEPK